MLKFWKKKPTETAEERRQDAPATAADAAAQDQIPALGEALAEAAPPEAAPAPPEPAPPPDEPIESLPEQPPPPPAAAETAATGKRTWRERLSGSGFARGLSTLFSRNPKLDDDLLDQLETTLITADVGVDASTQLVESLRKRMHKREFADANALLDALRKALVDQLTPVQQPLDVSGRKPFLILTVGINGVGKTTTIGKLARRFRDERRGVMLAAGDTFRAAAVEQLKTWGERNSVPVISQGQ